MDIEIKSKNPIQIIKVDFVNFKDKLVVTYKDLKTLKKYQKSVESPLMKYYFMNCPKEEFSKHTRYKKSELEEITVPYKEVIRDIIDRVQDPKIQNYARDLIASKNFYQLNNIHALDYRLFNSDMNIEDYYMYEFITKYHNDSEIYKTTKGHFDIEVDTWENQYRGFPDENRAECAINLITYYYTENKTLYILAYDNKKNESLSTFKNNLSVKGKKLKESIIEYFAKYKINTPPDFKVSMEFFDTELECILKFITLKNKHQPDIMNAWNNKFDIITIQNRLEQKIRASTHLENTFQYKQKVNSLFCGKASKIKNSYFYLDNRNTDEADNGSYFVATDYSIYTDAMLIYAALRKQLGKEESMTLEYISNKLLGVGKVKFSKKKKENIRNLAYINYFKFLKYGAIDTMLLHFMEEKTNDLDQVYSLSLTTFTRCHKVMKKTISLKNLYRSFILKKGYILSNNFNVINTVKETFKGGYVVSPELNSNNGTVIKV